MRLRLNLNKLAHCRKADVRKFINMKTEQDIFLAYLKSRGLNLTAERSKILQTVFSFHRHFDLDDLYDEIRRHKARVSRATIYRTIPLLMESGLIREVFRCMDRPHYEHIYGHDHHDHMICLGCGKVLEFKDERIEKLQNEVCAEFGFESVEHRLGIRGYCRECREGQVKRRGAAGT